MPAVVAGQLCLCGSGSTKRFGTEPVETTGTSGPRQPSTFCFPPQVPSVPCREGQGSARSLCSSPEACRVFLSGVTATLWVPPMGSATSAVASASASRASPASTVSAARSTTSGLDLKAANVRDGGGANALVSPSSSEPRKPGRDPGGPVLPRSAGSGPPLSRHRRFSRRMLPNVRA